jgi:hypothetical protein
MHNPRKRYNLSPPVDNLSIEASVYGGIYVYLHVSADETVMAVRACARTCLTDVFLLDNKCARVCVCVCVRACERERDIYIYITYDLYMF